jgi:hypothetical protein
MHSVVRTLGLIGIFIATLPVQAQTFTSNTAAFDASFSGASATSISLADFNNDGRLDIFFPGALYKQEADGTFTNVLKNSGIAAEGDLPRGGVFGDANMDGLLDLLLFEGVPGSRLYLNKTGGKFELGNVQANLQLTQAPIGGFWRDMNADGWLDFAAIYRGGDHALYQSFANARFSEQGAFFNFRSAPNVCSVAPGDYDNDGDADVFVAGCTAANSLLSLTTGFRARFQDRAAQAGVASTRRSREAGWLDYNNDGWLDLIVANEYQELSNWAENLLYENQTNSRFVERAEAAGVLGQRRPGLNGPLAIADFDNDGWQDIYLPAAGVGKLYHNNQDGTFTDVFESAFGFAEAPSAIGVGDFNNDGWIDLFDPNHGILYNNGGSNNWVTIEVREDIKNRFGVGATLRLTANGITQARVIEAGSGGLGHGDLLTSHFGIGSATQIDQLEIEWPAGVSETYTDVAINSHHVFVQGLGPNVPPSSFTQLFPVVAGYVDPADETVRFEWEPSTDTEPLTYTLNISGQALSLSFPGLTDAFFELPAALLPNNRVYEWSVSVTDGHSVRYSGEERVFTYGQPGNTVSVFEPPVSYNFGLPAVYDGVAKFVDMDRDGDLDLLFGGQGTENGVLSMYRTENANIPLPGDGGGSYVFKSLVLTPIYLEAMRYPKVAFGDMNGDQFPDLLVSGISSIDHAVRSNLYLNIDGDFQEVTTSVIQPVWGGSVAWGDLDNDGDEDLVLAGSSSLEAPYVVSTTIYDNDGNGGFTVRQSNLPGIMFGDISLADMDGDGDLDIAMTGDRGDGNLFSDIFRNDGPQFTELFLGFPGLVSGTVDWADFDLDGDQDLLLSGGKISPELFRGQTLVYVNQNGSFTQHPFPFDGVMTGDAVWGDYEQDGDPDLFVAGSSTPLGLPVARLFRNENGQFAPELDLVGVSSASVAFGDYNGDGDLDLITIGRDEDGKIRISFLINQQIPELIPGQ